MPLHEVTGAIKRTVMGGATVQTAGNPGEPPTRRLAIVGNVCVGKTLLFDLLCARNERAVNIPGSTKEVNQGILALGPGPALGDSCGGCRGHCSSEPSVTLLYDTPGSATLVGGNDQETVSRDLLLGGAVDGVVLVADAKNLRRSLALALEVAQFELPMMLDLNMFDEAESMGLVIDEAVLARDLAVPVSRTVATARLGVSRLSEMLLDTSVPRRVVSFPDTVEAGLSRLENILENPTVAPRGLAILLLCGDPGARSWTSTNLGQTTRDRASEVVDEIQSAYNTPLRELIAGSFYDEAERIVERAVSRGSRDRRPLETLGKLATKPLSGTLMAVVVLVLAYAWVGAFGATFVVDKVSARFFGELLIPACARAVALIPVPLIRDAIMDPDFGLIPTGLFLALGIVLPVLFCFYLLQAVLEDSGYLPRLAVLSDRLLRRLGLSGQGLIPLVVGFSCIATAVITTRTLSTRKERLILTLLLVGVPCAPLLAVMVVILGRMPWSAAAVVFGLVGLRIVVAGFLASKILPGPLPDLILEIPPMRIPRLRNVLSRTWRNTWQFMREAVPVFLGASLAVFLFARAGGLQAVEYLARPLVRGLLGLPDEAVQVFIKTAIRREMGAAELNLVQGQFDSVQVVVALVVMTFLMPCLNTTIVTIKERGLTSAAVIFGAVVVSALATGAAVNLVCRGLGLLLT